MDSRTGRHLPDTIESGGAAQAGVIETHHNRVAGIRRLIAGNRIVEPLSSFYKDEVRQVGRELGRPEELIERHPFPGPGLAVRCLCSEADYPLQACAGGWVMPVHSVGERGDGHRAHQPRHRPRAHRRSAGPDERAGSSTTWPTSRRPPSSGNELLSVGRARPEDRLPTPVKSGVSGVRGILG